jgi:hypothetical protein
MDSVLAKKAENVNRGTAMKALTVLDSRIFFIGCKRCVDYVQNLL